MAASWTEGSKNRKGRDADDAAEHQAHAPPAALRGNTGTDPRHSTALAARLAQAREIEVWMSNFIIFIIGASLARPGRCPLLSLVPEPNSSAIGFVFLYFLSS